MEEVGEDSRNDSETDGDEEVVVVVENWKKFGENVYVVDYGKGKELSGVEMLDDFHSVYKGVTYKASGKAFGKIQRVVSGIVVEEVLVSGSVYLEKDVEVQMVSGVGDRKPSKVPVKLFRPWRSNCWMYDDKFFVGKKEKMGDKKPEIIACYPRYGELKGGEVCRIFCNGLGFLKVKNFKDVCQVEFGEKIVKSVGDDGTEGIVRTGIYFGTKQQRISPVMHSILCEVRKDDEEFYQELKKKLRYDDFQIIEVTVPSSRNPGPVNISLLESTTQDRILVHPALFCYIDSKKLMKLKDKGTNKNLESDAQEQMMIGLKENSSLWKEIEDDKVRVEKNDTLDGLVLKRKKKFILWYIWVKAFEGTFQRGKKENIGVIFDGDGRFEVRGYFKNDKLLCYDLQNLEEPFLKNRRKDFGWKCFGALIHYRKNKDAQHRPKVIEIFIKKKRHAAKVFMQGDPKNEILTSFSFKHENVLRSYFWGTGKEMKGFDSKPLIVSEYGQHLRKQEFEGKTLREKIRMLLDVCRGMAYLHSIKCAHLDLKWDNVLRFESGDLKIIDFGCSKNWDKEKLDNYQGTDGYVAPEVFAIKKSEKPNPYSEKCDIFSFGILMWELLTNKNIHHFKSGMDKRRSELETSLRNLEQSQKSVNEKVEEIRRFAENVDPEKKISYRNIVSSSWLKANDVGSPKFLEILKEFTENCNKLVEKEKKELIGKLKDSGVSRNFIIEKNNFFERYQNETQMKITKAFVLELEAYLGILLELKKLCDDLEEKEKQYAAAQSRASVPEFNESLIPNQELLELMKTCYAIDYRKRKSFEEIVDQLQRILQ